MTTTKDTANKLYGQKLRVRVCGILIKDNAILLARHQGLGTAGYLWIPPGGGVEFGEKAHDALVREFREETSLAVEIKNLVAVHEFLQPPLHALELFFVVELKSGDVKTGSDPEILSGEQILKEVRFLPLEELKLMPAASLHPILRNISNFQNLKKPGALFWGAE